MHVVDLILEKKRPFLRQMTMQFTDHMLLQLAIDEYPLARQ